MPDRRPASAARRRSAFRPSGPAARKAAGRSRIPAPGRSPIALPSFLAKVASRRFSRTVRLSNRRLPSGTWEIPSSLTTLSAGYLSRSRPMKRHFRPRFDRDEAGNRPQGGALPRSVGADDAHDLPLVDPEAYTMKGLDIVVGNMQVFHGQQHQITLSLPR